ncbi:spore germination protein KB [Bacillus sp. SORGH_AS 510]|uniref:GerAB/ArcD/ProY family transporter n=1 Tax=Bacillus sp. SORGH_AS_0510 TaxID=3041771 RepID=UPI002789FA85|nr:endospore germination permease [Bacillus sp. SORGH_AS_0510]MDQ1146621.1 spore germination protein KB [Bacillus sp. SORGH_AS_0510]
MNQSNGTVGIREYVATMLLIIGVKLSDSTPALYFDSLKSAAWMGPLIGGVITVIPLYFLIKVLNNYDSKNLHDINISIFGKYIGFLLSFIFWIYGSMVIAVDSRSYVDIIATLYFVKTPTIVIFIALMGACAYTAMKGIQNLTSLSWIVLFYVKGTLLLGLLLILKDANTFAVFPFWGPGFKEVMTEGTLKTSLYGDFLFISLIFPFFTSKKVFSKGSWIALAFLTIEIPISFVLYLFMFDYAPASLLTYPFHEVIRYLSIGDFLTSIDTFFFPFWLVASLMRFSIYLYLNALLLGNLFKIKQFEYSIPILASVFLIVGMIPETPSFTIFKLRDPLYQLFTPIFIIFPILLWGIAKLKGDFKNETKKNNA